MAVSSTLCYIFPFDISLLPGILNDKSREYLGDIANDADKRLSPESIAEVRLSSSIAGLCVLFG